MAGSLRRIPMPASATWTTIAAMRISLTVVISEAAIIRYDRGDDAERNRSSRIHLSEEPLAGADLLRLTHDLRSEDDQQ